MVVCVVYAYNLTIIEMFNLPENIKELVPVSSPLPDLDLQTEPQLPLEEFSLLDYSNDSNYQFGQLETNYSNFTNKSVQIPNYSKFAYHYQF